MIAPDVLPFVVYVVILGNISNITKRNAIILGLAFGLFLPVILCNILIFHLNNLRILIDRELFTPKDNQGNGS